MSGVEMPKDVYAEVAPRLERGHLFSPDVLLDALSNVDGFIASQQRREAAKKLLESRGFKVLADNTITLTVAISEEGLMEFARSIGQTNRLAALMAGAEGRLADDDIRSSFLELSHSDAGDLVAGIAIAPPVLTSAAVLIEPTPPHVPYDHILAPRDLVDLLRVAPLHAYGNFGNGIRVTVVDSGCFVDHPFFADIGAHIRVELGPGSDHPQIDEIGHGTLVCGNLVSIAPRSEVTVLKTADNASLAGFKLAATAPVAPNIIQNTWGFEQTNPPITAYGRAVMLAIRHAVGRGIIVIFAGGNERRLFTSQVPESLSIGGVYLFGDAIPQAASYASGYTSNIFPGRIMPDLCGLVGMKPRGIYLALPTQPGSAIDQSFAGCCFPEHDQTEADDGWVVISGTSSASAQVSGVCALLLEIEPGLCQDRMKDLLERSSRPVTAGVSAEGNPAGPPNPNLATGFGLVDAAAAARMLQSASAVGWSSATLS